MKNDLFNTQSKLRYTILIGISFIIVVLYGCSNDDAIVPEMNKTKPAELKVSQQIVPKAYPLNKDEILGVVDFGMRTHPILKVKKLHIGMDFRAKKGTEVYATADGVVVKADYSGGYGNRILIKHSDEYSTLYAHLQSFYVTTGKQVKAGDLIGYIGATGMATVPILHYEVRLNDKFVNPKNYLH